MRTGNPVLSQRAFEGLAQGARTAERSQLATIEGTTYKTALVLLIVLATAMWSWKQIAGGVADALASQTGYSMPWYVWGSAIAGFVLALITVFKMKWAGFTTPIYAALQGVFLGAISQFVAMRFPAVDIVFQAVVITFGILFAVLIAYRTGVIRATPTFKKCIIVATAGIGILYFLTFILGFFGISMPFIHDSSMIGIGFSLFVVVIASMNLVLDFDLIEQGVQRGLPKYFEWYGAFALLVTLVWLYLEILHLLSKLQGRRN